MTQLAYQYVVLRCVPRADREEFVNVGVVLYCEDAKFLGLDWHLDPPRLLALDSELELGQIQSALEFASAICSGGQRSDGSANDETLGQRFGMLKAPRSTVLQPGPVHGGVTVDPERELEVLLGQLVATGGGR
jgi:Protein of unknown function (DUF3037)